LALFDRQYGRCGKGNAWTSAMHRTWLQCRVAFQYFPQRGNNSPELSGYPAKRRLTMLPVQKQV